MKIFLWALFASTFVAVFNLANGHHHSSGKPQSFTTLLDHFNPQDGRLVNFTYLLKDDYFRVNGPIYINVQEPDGLTNEFLMAGLMHDIAKHTGAALVTANPRFYRDNLPTQNASTENLEYLTVDQIISDIPHLINAVRTDLNGSANSRVILFGSGYGATIATWARQKFPHLVYAVYSSSGVFQLDVHSGVPLEDLSESIRTVGGVECAADLEEAFVQTHILMLFGDVANLSRVFKTCFWPSYYDDDDVALFFRGISKVIADYVNANHADGVRNLCSALAEKDETLTYAEFIAFSNWVHDIFSDEYCIDLSIDSRLRGSLNDNWDFIREQWWQNNTNTTFPIASRSTLWLECTQLGGFETTVNSNSLFEHNIGQDLFFQFCSYIFGEQYDYNRLHGAVANLNERFGGRVPGVTRAIFTNGLLDTARSKGKLSSDATGAQTHVFNISNYGKSADLSSIDREADSSELILVKEAIVRIVTEWGVEV